MDTFRTLCRIQIHANSIIDKLPNKGTQEDVIIFSYYISLIDSINDIIILAERKRYNNIPSILRTMLETYIDVSLIIKSSNFIYPLSLKSYKYKLKYFNEMLKEENLSESQQEILTKEKKQIEIEIKNISIKVKGQYDIRSFAKKFEELDLMWLYNSIYNNLSSHSHYSINQIDGKYITVSGISKVSLNYKEHSSVNFDSNFNVIKYCLMGIIGKIEDKYEIGITDILEKIKELDIEINNI